MFWLYSMSNLLVIQHLEILHLGGNNLRVVRECEDLIKSVQQKGDSRVVTC